MRQIAPFAEVFVIITGVILVLPSLVSILLSNAERWFHEYPSKRGVIITPHALFMGWCFGVITMLLVCNCIIH